MKTQFMDEEAWEKQKTVKPEMTHPAKVYIVDLLEMGLHPIFLKTRFVDMLEPGLCQIPFKPL